MTIFQEQFEPKPVSGGLRCEKSSHLLTFMTSSLGNRYLCTRKRCWAVHLEGLPSGSSEVQDYCAGSRIADCWRRVALCSAGSGHSKERCKRKEGRGIVYFMKESYRSLDAVGRGWCTGACCYVIGLSCISPDSSRRSISCVLSCIPRACVIPASFFRVSICQRPYE